MKKRSMIAIVIILLGLTVLFLGFCGFKTTIMKNVHLLDENGKEIVAEISVDVRRPLFMSDILSGYIILNGIKYLSATDVTNMDYFMDIDALLSEPGSRSFVFFEENANVMDAVKLLVSMDDYSCTDVSIWRLGKDVSEIYSTPGYYDR